MAEGICHQFGSVEVNNSFYRLPASEIFQRWAALTPPGFRFAVKASRFLTHLRRLRDPEAPIDLLLERAGGLGDALGPVRFQLPPNLKVEPELLRDVLDAVHGRVRSAFEFRDPSWLADEVMSMLDASGSAIVLTDRAGRRSDLQVTGGWSNVRFHQGTAARPGYRRDTLRAWADRIASLPAEDVYVYFNNDLGAAAPRDAQRMIQLLAET